jgi:hypothetical protein
MRVLGGRHDAREQRRRDAQRGDSDLGERVARGHAEQQVGDQA